MEEEGSPPPLLDWQFQPRKDRRHPWSRRTVLPPIIGWSLPTGKLRILGRTSRAWMGRAARRVLSQTAANRLGSTDGKPPKDGMVQEKRAARGGHADAALGIPRWTTVKMTARGSTSSAAWCGRPRRRPERVGRARLTPRRGGAGTDAAARRVGKGLRRRARCQRQRGVAAPSAPPGAALGEPLE